MRTLNFERRKYGKELLIDACDETELEIVADTLVLSFYAIFFLEAGEGWYQLDAARYWLEPRTVMFIKPGQVSEVSRAKFEKGHFLFFEGDFLDEFFNDRHFIFKFGYFHHPLLPATLPLGPEDFEKYNGTAREIRQEIRQLSPDSPHILRALVYYLMVRLHQHYSRRHGSSGRTLTDPRILAFLQLLESRGGEQWRVEDAARALGISRVHLNSLCRKYFSKTANQILRERLMVEIKKAVKYSASDFSEIAYNFNFSAPSHFSRFVKAMTGQSPQQLRESLSNW